MTLSPALFHRLDNVGRQINDCPLLQPVSGGKEQLPVKGRQSLASGEMMGTVPS